MAQSSNGAPYQCSAVDVQELEMKLLQQLSVQEASRNAQDDRAPSQACLPRPGFKSPPELAGDPSLKDFARWESRYTYHQNLFSKTRSRTLFHSITQSIYSNPDAIEYDTFKGQKRNLQLLLCLH